MDGCETLNPKTAEWLRNIQTLKGVGECETLKPNRSEWLRNPHTLKKEGVRAQPQTRKGVGGCETLNPKRSGWMRNPKCARNLEAEKDRVGGCDKPKQTKQTCRLLLTAGHGHARGPRTAERRHGPL